MSYGGIKERKIFGKSFKASDNGFKDSEDQIRKFSESLKNKAALIKEV